MNSVPSMPSTPSMSPKTPGISSNKTTYIALAVIVVVIVLGVWLAPSFMQSTSNTSETTQSGASVPAAVMDLQNDLNSVDAQTSTLNQNLDSVDQGIKGL